MSAPNVGVPHEELVANADEAGGSMVDDTTTRQAPVGTYAQGVIDRSASRSSVFALESLRCCALRRWWRWSVDGQAWARRPRLLPIRSGRQPSRGHARGERGVEDGSQLGGAASAFDRAVGSMQRWPCLLGESEAAVSLLQRSDWHMVAPNG